MIQWMVLSDEVSLQIHATIAFGCISFYAAARCLYLLYFHPLSKFPGPKVAAVSNVWYAYHWFSGRYPWAIECVLRKYGDIVRIAPNELVFFTPKAVLDIYSPHHKNLEVFIKTDFQNRGKHLGGIVWEEDPTRHREVSKKISPAFSARSIKALEPIMHEYMDYFVVKMEKFGSKPTGVGLVEWTNWLAMDEAADMAWSEKLHQMRDQRNSVHLDVLLGFNAFTTVMQVFKRFPLLHPFQYLAAPVAKLKVLSAMEAAVRDGVMKRIERRAKTEHVDLFDYVLPANSPVPTDAHELTHTGALAQQMMFANYGPMADWFYGTLLFLIEEPEYLHILSKEIRDSFQSYHDITPSALASLPHLNACLQESLRLLPSNNTGLPRLSPGAVIDGHYVPKGVSLLPGCAF
ncbi:uncharacterized protein KY384_006650 [Bacidia gigantensis]|uniref:uncharacterized protein n=1 Tax=Bacidia gigantensis TaxID=2732470 RepID=UPI001D039F14|nr:uncharacterized protein KY384_006650 [Bacidia gigantensis]KAG8528961.1 hypothetical protein KY384_006650 [Bacidia gigantensis]